MKPLYLASLAVLLVCAGAARSVAAPPRAAATPDIGTLMVVLREVEGGNKQDTVLRPVGKVKATLPEGKDVDFIPAWFSFIGDMDIRFVYDGPTTMRGLSTDEFAALHLSPEEAVRLAVANIRRVYGEPHVSPWTSGLMLVSGKSPDLDSSYFLDRDFWVGLLKKHPEGLVVGVPRRGGLFFVPLSDAKAVEVFRRGIAGLYSTSENMRVSSALYLFKDNHWSVFQAARPVGH